MLRGEADLALPQLDLERSYSSALRGGGGDRGGRDATDEGDHETPPRLHVSAYARLTLARLASQVRGGREAAVRLCRALGLEHAIGVFEKGGLLQEERCFAAYNTSVNCHRRYKVRLIGGISLVVRLTILGEYIGNICIRSLAARCGDTHTVLNGYSPIPKILSFFSHLTSKVAV